MRRMRPGPHRGADDAEEAEEVEEVEEAADKVDGRALEAVSRYPWRIAGSIWVQRLLPTFPSGPGVLRAPSFPTGLPGARILWHRT